MIRGAPVAMAKKTRDRRKGQAMMRDMMARNERSNNASARNRPVRYGTTSKAEAEAMVRACKYSPDGDRSNSGPRGEWGEFDDYRTYMDTVNEELLIIPMIETQQAMDNIDEILSVPGIDVLLIGPSDLAIELEVPMESYETSKKYEKALDTIAAACKRHGVVPGMYYIPTGMDQKALIKKGYKFFTQPWAQWASEGIQNGISALKS